MYNEGKVIQIDGEYASVKIVREGACGHDCKSCAGCGPGKTTILALNEIHANEGDFVELEGDGKIVYRAFIVYLLPVLMFFIGYSIGWYALKFGDTPCIITGLIFFLGTIIFNILFSKREKEKGKIPKITKILS